MKKIFKIIPLIIVLFVTIGITYSFFSTSKTLPSVFKTDGYTFLLNAGGGTFDSNNNVIVLNQKATLPVPNKKGFNFLGYSKTENGNVNYSTDINNVESINKINLYAKWDIITYSITYDLNGGAISNQPTSYNVESNSFTLPTPTRYGYTFTGWTGTGLSSPTKSVSINKGSTGDKKFTANWSLNYHNVNYYLNGNLWAQRNVGYGNSIENLNAQSSLDIYHTFHGWTGWVDTMPNNDVNLYANITESYCRLMTGHGQYGNATALLNVFKSAGWTGTIIESSSYPGNYMVVTDYTLTRAQAEVQKNYIASHTNYKNYNYPYLYWVSVDCTNGYSEAWTRSLGQSSFN